MFAIRLQMLREGVLGVYLPGHLCPVALHFMYYNFVKIHQNLRTTPAQAAGFTDRLWEIEDLVALID